MANEPMNLTIEGARLIYRNFSGAETMFKAAGTRTFAVVLDKKTADEMLADGWNVKCKPAGVATDEDDESAVAEEFCFIEVTVSYKNRPPKITVITESGRTYLNENSVETLDWADFKNVDLIINAYHWSMPGGKSGVKAYLKTMFATINEDDLELKYAQHDSEGGG